MVKTRSDLKGIRVTAKAPRKMPASTTSSSPGGRSSKKYDGGNRHCPRETPPWQKEITKFFPAKQDDGSSSSKSDSESALCSTSANQT